MYNTMYWAPFLSSYTSTAADSLRKTCPSSLKKIVFFFDRRRACLPETVSTKTKLRKSAAVELLGEKEGAEYIVLYIRFRQDVFEPPVGPKNNFENGKNQEKDKLKKGQKPFDKEV